MFTRVPRSSGMTETRGCAVRDGTRGREIGIESSITPVFATLTYKALAHTGQTCTGPAHTGLVRIALSCNTQARTNPPYRALTLACADLICTASARTALVYTALGCK